MSLLRPFALRHLASPSKLPPRSPLHYVPVAAYRSRASLFQQQSSRNKEDILDKDALNPRPSEYSKSGGDDESAAVEEAAFDPKKTSPEAQMEQAGKEEQKAGKSEDQNPLNVSPANKNLGTPKDEDDGTAAKGKQMGP